jgi:hypothetical protein
VGSKVVLATVLAFAAFAASAQAATLYAITAREVYVRNDHGAFVIGTAKGPAFAPLPGVADTVLVQRYARGRDWGYGLVGGRFPLWRGERCGWIHLQRTRGKVHRRFVRRISTGHAQGCNSTGKQLTEPTLFRKGSYIHAAGGGSVYAATIKPCADPRAFGNYSPVTGEFTDPYPVPLPAGHGLSIPGFGQRYVTLDGRAAMLKDSSHTPHSAPVAGASGGPIWYFVHADCVDRLPSYAGAVRENGICCTGAWLASPVRPYTLFVKRRHVAVLVKWRSWGGDAVRGRATIFHNLCKPTCAAGNTAKYPARVQLGRRRTGTCGNRTIAFYTRLSAQWRVPHVKRARRATRTLLPACATF